MKRTIIGAAVLGVAAVLVTPAQAFAGTNVPWTKSTDKAPGAKGKFTAKGDVVNVCDIEEDGWAAFVKLSKWSARDSHYIEVDEYHVGGKNRCKPKSYDKYVTEGLKVKIEVCLWKKDKFDKYCRKAYGRA